MQLISGISVLANRYDALLLDLWGVVHDGTHLYPGVKETLMQLRKANKKIVMISNAPRRAYKAEKVLLELGVAPDCYDGIMTSGEAGYRWLESGQAPWGKRYYYIGPAKDADILAGLDYQRIDDIKQADFLLNVGFGSEEQAADDWMPLLRAARRGEKPMLCLNPDLEVVKQTGERFPCAGVIGQAYEQLLGKVVWFGKPYPVVYEACMQLLGPVPKERTLVVGDSLDTDIRGAINNGFDSLLITGGILRQHPPVELVRLCDALPPGPSFIAQRLAW